MQENYFQTNKQYKRGFKIDEYRGEISLVACNEGSDGKIYSEWVTPQGRDCKPKQKQDGSYITLPLKIKIGDSVKSALDTLRQIASVLKSESSGSGYAPPVANHQSYQPNESSDIPF